MWKTLVSETGGFLSVSQCEFRLRLHFTVLLVKSKSLVTPDLCQRLYTTERMLLQHSSHWILLSGCVKPPQDKLVFAVFKTAIDPCWKWHFSLYLVSQGENLRRWLCVRLKSSYFKGYTRKGSLITRHRAHSRSVFWRTFLLLIFFFFLLVLWRWQDESTVWVLFKHVSYTELKYVVRK